MSDEATLSQRLRTPPLPATHALVGYWWQNTRLHPVLLCNSLAGAALNMQAARHLLCMYTSTVRCSVAFQLPRVHRLLLAVPEGWPIFWAARPRAARFARARVGRATSGYRRIHRSCRRILVVEASCLGHGQRLGVRIKRHELGLVVLAGVPHRIHRTLRPVTLQADVDTLAGERGIVSRPDRARQQDQFGLVVRGEAAVRGAIASAVDAA